MSYNFIVPDSDYPESAPYIMISFMSRDVLKDVIKDCRETMSRTDVEKYDAFKIACDIVWPYRDWETDRKSTRLNSSHRSLSRMPSSA